MAITPAVRIDPSFFGGKAKQAASTREQIQEKPAAPKSQEPAAPAASKPVARRSESVLSAVQKADANIKVMCSSLKILAPVVGGDTNRMIEHIDIAEAVVTRAIEKMGVTDEEAIVRLMPTMMPTVVNMVVRGNLTVDSVERVATGLAYAGTKIPAGSRIEQYTTAGIDAIELRRSAMASITPVIAEMGSFRFSSHEKDDLEMAVKHIIAAVMNHLPELAPDGVGELSTVILAQSMMNNFGVILAGAWRKNTYDALDMTDDIALKEKISLTEAMDRTRAHCDWSRKIREDFNSMADKLVTLTKEIIVLDYQKPTRMSTKIRKRTGVPS